MKFNKYFTRLKGDASPRIFYRNKKKRNSSIFVYAKKDKRSNLLIYDAINKIFIENKILAPKLISENYSKNFIEIQDFGNQTIFGLFKNNSVKKFEIFKKIIKLLIKIQLIKQRKIKDFKKKNYQIPIYKQKILLNEAKIFVDWYVLNILPKSEKLIFKKKFARTINDLIKKLRFKNETLVHRDFHVSNLMMVRDEIGLIDTQDALIGNIAYDLASLIDDVRFKTSNKMKKKILNYYLLSQKQKINKKKFINDFEIISVLRNLKIIGIFIRLAIRDNKKGYLKLIPYAWDLIKLRSKNKKTFKNLNLLLSDIENFK